MQDLVEWFEPEHYMAIVEERAIMVSGQAYWHMEGSECNRCVARCHARATVATLLVVQLWPPARRIKSINRSIV